MARRTAEQVTRCNGNVFVDMGLAVAVELGIKARWRATLNLIIEL